MEQYGNLAGTAMFAVGLFMAWQAFSRRRRVLAEARQRRETGEPAPGPRMHQSLQVLSAVGPAVVNLGLFIAGGQVVLAFFMTGGGGVFTLFDLAGFVFLLVAYGWWVSVKTYYRPGHDPDGF
jgi:hypothetical protein